MNHTWFYNDVRHLTAGDLNRLKNKTRENNAYTPMSFGQYIQNEYSWREFYVDCYREARVLDNYSSMSFWNTRIKPTTDPYARGYKKSVWKRIQWNMYRLHRKKKLRAGEVKTLLRYYGTIAVKKEVYGDDYWRFVDTGIMDLFRIDDDRIFYSVGEYERYIAEHPTAVYAISEYTDSEVSREDLTKLSLGIVQDFFRRYPYGAIEIW